MSLIHIEGFELYETIFGAGASAEPTMSLLGNPISGNYGLVEGRSGSGSQALWTRDADATDGFYIHLDRIMAASYAGPDFGLSIAHAASQAISPFQRLVALSRDTSAVIQLRMNPDASITVVNGAGTNLGTTSSGVFIWNSWHHYELVGTMHTSTGSFILYVDGVEVLNVNNVNVSTSSGDTEFNRVHLYSAAPSTVTTNKYFDDIAVRDDNTALGDTRVAALSPTADTAQKDFTPSSGSTNYNLIDDVPMIYDTNYVQSGTVGHKDIYELANLPAGSEIFGIKLVSYASTDNASVVTIRQVLESGVTTENGDTVALSTQANVYQDIWGNDPNTAAAWTLSNFNNVKVGFEVV